MHKGNRSDKNKGKQLSIIIVMTQVTTIVAYVNVKLNKILSKFPVNS